MELSKVKELAERWDPEGKYDEGEYYDGLWSFMYHEEDGVTIEGVEFKYVDSYRAWPMADPMIYVVVEVDGKFYRNGSYYDSWNGSSDWESGTVEEVHKVEVTTEEWRTV